MSSKYDKAMKYSNRVNLHISDIVLCRNGISYIVVSVLNKDMHHGKFYNCRRLNGNSNNVELVCSNEIEQYRRRIMSDRQKKQLELHEVKDSIRELEILVESAKGNAVAEKKYKEMLRRKRLACSLRQRNLDKKGKDE